MQVARHARPVEIADWPLERIMERYVARFKDRVPDWNAFSDASIEGYLAAKVFVEGLKRARGAGREAFIDAINKFDK